MTKDEIEQPQLTPDEIMEECERVLAEFFMDVLIDAIGVDGVGYESGSIH